MEKMKNKEAILEGDEEIRGTSVESIENSTNYANIVARVQRLAEGGEFDIGEAILFVMEPDKKDVFNVLSDDIAKSWLISGLAAQRHTQEYQAFLIKQGMKQVNNDKDTRLAKKAKVEGNNKATELPIHVGEGKAVMLNDVELNKLHTSTRDKTKEEEEEEEAQSDEVLTKLRTHTDGNAKIGDEVNRLRGLLADDPEKLSEKLSKNDMDNVIRYLEVDEIVSLVLKSFQGKGSDDGEEESIDEVDPYVPSSRRLFKICRIMLRRIEKVKEADFPLVYENLPYADFAPLLLFALESYSNRCCGGVSLLKGEDRDMIPKLCRVLPWKLFAHILSYKTSLPLFTSTSVETSEESNEELIWY